MLKNINIERLRVLASFGIVCFHSQSGLLKTIGYVGLPVFIMLTFAFGVIKDKPSLTVSSSHLFRRYATAKIKRLLLPYLVWVFIYGVWGGVRLLLSRGDLINVPVSFLIPLYGTSIHLWYLPFVFISLVSLSLLKVYFPIKRTATLGVYLVAGLLAGLLPVFFSKMDHMLLPLPQILFALPAVFVGLIIADDVNVCKPSKYFLALVFIIFVGSIRLFLWDDSSFFFLYLTAFLLVSIAQNIAGRPDKITEKLSSLTFGIYLIHPIMISVVANLLGYHNAKGLMPEHSLIIYVLSAYCIYYARRTRFRRFV